MNMLELHKGILRARQEERKHLPCIIGLVIIWIIAIIVFYVIL